MCISASVFLASHQIGFASTCWHASKSANDQELRWIDEAKKNFCLAFGAQSIWEHGPGLFVNSAWSSANDWGLEKYVRLSSQGSTCFTKKRIRIICTAITPACLMRKAHHTLQVDHVPYSVQMAGIKSKFGKRSLNFSCQFSAVAPAAFGTTSFGIPLRWCLAGHRPQMATIYELFQGNLMQFRPDIPRLGLGRFERICVYIYIYIQYVHLYVCALYSLCIRATSVLSAVEDDWRKSSFFPSFLHLCWPSRFQHLRSWKKFSIFSGAPIYIYIHVYIYICITSNISCSRVQQKFDWILYRNTQNR